ncbi:MAG: polyprenyl synthetase family protein [Bacteroidales bacterium]|jgi:geranylgeranyl diphosphate synthase type II|nr:polyprenyl synthetase family protein [Bacteroidales bacterium]HOL97373.1 polyprenyl synthetase family protein [Bacteroidales bacterium]HOM36104.1 polyprenyl synthetase family protein [Bacteroidales bacterium]HPD22940.1 polyprenyl synthetase family protein [Bacteroidales bacterium]HRS98609.1 polyprenyl synthetase family protein [Bacteroidales bacterium]
MLNAEDFLKIINEGIKHLDFGNEPKNLYDPINYSLSVGGKRIRPVLCLLACQACGGDYKNALNAAYAIEIFHNFTLLHDDMMDNATLRRGKAVVHVKWNSNIALLSGDAMSVIAYKYISKTKNLVPVLDVFSDTALKICEGQQYDMDFETRTDVSEEEYIKMINLKTAVLIAASLKIGALVADADFETANNLYECGRNIGLAFQLQDDYLDSFGNAKIFGKKIGGDIVSNKKTYLLIKALQISNKFTKEKLIKLLNQKDFDPEEKIKAVLKIYEELKIKKFSEELMNFYIAQADRYFDKLNINSNEAEILREYLNSLKLRKY